MLSPRCRNLSLFHQGLRKNLSADDLANSFAEVVFQVLPGHAPRKVVHVQLVRRDLDHPAIVEIR